MENKKTPSLREIYSGDVDTTGKHAELNQLLNKEPKKEWIKVHPIAKGVLFIPIERIEYLLTKIFVIWYVKIKTVKIIGNSVLVTITLYYQDPITNNMLRQDGIGAAPLQTDKGAGAIDFNSLKSDSVMKAAPAAESFAIKDAAEKIGKLFGKDLNRADNIQYQNLTSRFQQNPSPDRVAYAEKLMLSSTLDDRMQDDIITQLMGNSLTITQLEDIIQNLEISQKEGEITNQKSINNIMDSRGF